MAPLGQSVNPRFEQQVRGIMRGDLASAGASLLRLGLGIAEPFYAGAMRVRNRLFDARLREVRRVPRPVISIGNITTGGTGKTPVVRWLAERLRSEGRNVAILSRGYRASGAGPGDELMMLERALNRAGEAPVALRANPDRYAAATQLIREWPEVDVFVLDDAFQHRRMGRDLDVVLISAAEPFGFGHVLPRGLLREPLSGLARAGAFIITHMNLTTPDSVAAIESTLRAHNPAAPIHRAVHAHVGLETSIPGGAPEPMDALARQPFFAFCGIGDPATFDAQLQLWKQTYRGRRWFPDHHAYTPADVESLATQARAAGAAALVTTEKDWAKLEHLPASAGSLPIWRVQARIEFLGNGEAALLEQIRGLIDR